ncbi:hypothetical protein V6N13_063696 [Hibiscus sabdariffa]
MANQTIRDLAAAPAVQQPFCITFPFFPVAKASEIRRSIIGIMQKHEESLYEYWERYKKLCASCPQHGLSDHTLIQYFYEGLLPMEMKMIDAASGGALFNMTPTQGRELISKMAANSQQFGTTSEPNRWVHEEETVNAVGNFPGPPQRPYNPHKNTYNPGWRDHPNLSYAPNLTYQPRPPQPYQPPHKPSLENLVEQLAQSQVQFQNRTESHLQELDKHVSQLAPLGVIVERLAQTVSRLESQGKLLSQTEGNPRENVSAITLRSGTVIEPPVQEKKEAKKLTNSDSQKDDDATTQKENSIPESEQSPYAEPPPFPARLIKKDKQAEEKEILDIFRKVEINLPLLGVIRKVPRYVCFIIYLCTNKRKLLGHEKVNLGEHVSVVLTRRLPSKLKDQGMFTIPCKIADPLKETRVTVQLADRTVIYPEGVLENVLVKVNELIFPADFYVIDMESDHSNTSSEIILGRPFLGTANMKIEVRSGLLTMEFDGEIAKFNIYKAMQNPENVQSVNFVGIFEPAIDEFIETNFVNDLCMEIEDFEDVIRNFRKSFSVNSDLCYIPSKSKISLSVLQEPKIELKLPPEQLSKGCTLSAIISKPKKIRKNAYDNNRTYNSRRISLKEILSWTKRLNWRKSQCL